MNNTCKYPKSQAIFNSLKKLADKKGKDFTPKYLAYKFQCDESKISRIKNGERELRAEFIYDMLEYLDLF